MRLTYYVLSIALILMSTTGYAQITLKEKNTPLEKVLTAIERQTQFVFLYDPNEVKMVTVTINIKNATLQETLAQIFKDIPIGFTLVGNNVLLKRSRPENLTSARTAELNITGKVIDENGQPLMAVTVINKRENKGTQTDSSGTFIIPAAKGDILRFSFVGYTEREIRISEQRSINIALDLKPVNPEQVVVVGYGSTRRKDLTGSVAIVKTKDFSQIPFNTVDNALAGRAAGVQVNKTDGTPGGMARIRIRGSSSLLGGNDPLYVIDGIPVQVRSNFIDPGFKVASPLANLTNNFGGGANGAALSGSFINGLNSLSGLNPEDIETITILKDASSMAIYGSKASNGVVIITTKTGNKNMPPRVSVNYYTTVSTAYKTPKLLNASQYKILLTEAAQNTLDKNAAQGFPMDPFLSSILDSTAYFGTANTDWIKEVTRNTVSQNIALSVSGGGNSSKYYSSIAYTNTPGVVRGTNFRRISGKINLETEFRRKLRIVTNLLVGYSDQDIGDGAYTQALVARPDWAVRDAAGNYTDFKLQGYGYGIEGFLNPAALVSATNNGRTFSLLGSLSAIYAISSDLRFSSTASLNMQNYNQRNYLPSYIDKNTYFGDIDNTGGIGSNANSRFADWFVENTITLNKKYNKNAFNAVIGQSYQTTRYSYFRATASGFPNDNFLNGLSAATTPLSVAGDEPRSPQSYLLSFYGRANYSYRDKYIATFTGRADGSSKFGPDNKYGFFPSGALAWRISRENFLKNARWVDDIKLRVSYGLTGNQNIGDQMYRTLYNPVSYAGQSALIPVQLGNNGIKWETTREADAGLDISVLNGRLNATVDYYNKQTNGGLISLPVAASSSYRSLLQNAVGLRNRGLEVSIGGDIIRGRNFRWTADMNVTWNNSLVTKLDPRADLTQIFSLSGLESIADPDKFSPGNTIIKQGQSLGLIAGKIITGIIRTQAELDAYIAQRGNSVGFGEVGIGDPMYLLNTNPGSFGFQEPLNNIVIANCAPKYFGGMHQEVSYKRFAIQCYFTFSQGGHLLWAQHSGSIQFYGTANAERNMLNRYTAKNLNSDRPRLLLSDEANSASNLDVFSSSYLKLRSLTLNYHVKNIEIFISATNVFTITTYPGSDPETSDDPYSVIGGYIDNGNYPATRTFSLGLKAVF